MCVCVCNNEWYRSSCLCVCVTMNDIGAYKELAAAVVHTHTSLLILHISILVRVLVIQDRERAHIVHCNIPNYR